MVNFRPLGRLNFESSLWPWPVSFCMLCLTGRRWWIFSEHLMRVCCKALTLSRTYEATSWRAANHIQTPSLGHRKCCLSTLTTESRAGTPISSWDEFLDFPLRSGLMALLTGYPWLEERGKKGGFYFLLGRHRKSCPYSRPNSSPPSSLQLSLSPLDFLYLYTPAPIGPAPTAPEDPISNSFIEIQFIYHAVHPL